MNAKIAAVAVVLLFHAVPGFAQWMKTTDKSIPRTRDGQANLSAPAPRVGGRPDLSGVWHPDPDPMGVPINVEQMIFPRYFINIARRICLRRSIRLRRPLRRCSNKGSRTKGGMRRRLTASLQEYHC
jgi:hypothetical protein